MDLQERKRLELNTCLMDTSYDQNVFSKISIAEWKKFQQFLETHSLKYLRWNKSEITYCICGDGEKTILTFAGGWGGIEVLYNTILYFEKNYKILIIDVSILSDSLDLSRAVNMILEFERIEHTILFGQSFSGIIAQIFLIGNQKKVSKLILVNTPALYKIKARKWVKYIIQGLPFFIIRSILISKLKKFGTYNKPIPEEALNRIKFTRALIIRDINQNASKTLLNNILSNIQSAVKSYSQMNEKMNSWIGETLIISSEDDIYYSDSQELSRRFPNASLILLNSGYKHISPSVHHEELHQSISVFIES